MSDARSGEGPVVTAARMPLAFLGVCGVFAGLTVLLGRIVDRAAELPNGIRCADVSDFFYTPPCPQEFSWIWLSSAFGALCVVMTVPAYLWRRALTHAFAPPAERWRLGRTQHPANAVVPLLVGVGIASRYASAYGPPFEFSTIDELIIAVPLWSVVPLGLAIVSVFDISTIAARPDDRSFPLDADGAQRLRDLRLYLDRFLFILGTLLGAWVITHAANAEYVIAVREIQTATAGPDLTSGKIVVVTGAVATALLALVYVPTAIAIDHLAARMVGRKAQELDAGDTPTAEELQRFRADVTADRPVRDRLQAGLSIAAPLTGALFTAFVL